MSTAFGDIEKEVFIVVEAGVVVAMFTVPLTATFGVPDAVKIKVNAVLTPPATSLSWSSDSSIKISTLAHS